MPPPKRRMNQLKPKLLSLRVGPAAAVMPTDITRIHMAFAWKLNEGHMGPRKFWRTLLPQLKFWNPAVPMIVTRTKEQTVPATMTLYFRDRSAGTFNPGSIQKVTSTLEESANNIEAPPPVEGERTVTIDMKHKHSDAILKEFMEKSGAVPVKPTPQDEFEQIEAEERMKQAEVDRQRVARMIREQRRDRALMAQARSQAAAIKAGS